MSHLPTGVWVARNEGAGVFGEFLMLDIPGLVNVVAVTVADVDADASLDLLLHYGIELSLARNSGNGTFTRPEPLLSILLLAHLFLGVAAPGCLEAADADGDGALNLTDAIFILDFLFLGGLPPPEPGPTADPCGPGSGSLPCETYSSCRA